MLKRTTVRLDEGLFKLAKKRAIDEGITFQELVNRALRRYLERRRLSLGVEGDGRD